MPLDLRGLDPLIASLERLGIMATLVRGDVVEFTLLRERLDLTDGNLSAHLRKLENAGDVRYQKSFLDRRPRTTYRITPRGHAAFRRHVAALERVMETSRQT